MCVCMYVCIVLKYYSHLILRSNAIIYIYIYVCIYMYVYIYICMYICIYIYIYIYVNELFQSIKAQNLN